MPPDAPDRLVAIIDCRGDKGARRFFTRWHEVAHFLVEPEAEAVTTPVRRASDSPMERLMDEIAAHAGFYEPIFGPAFDRETAGSSRLETCATNGQGFGIVDGSEIPKAPKQRESLLATTAFDRMKIRPAFNRTGYVDIEKNDHETKVEIECGNIQPGRRVWTDAFWMGIGQSGEVNLIGHLYAANLPQPQEFTLTIHADVNRTTLTVEELVALGKQEPESDEE